MESEETDQTVQMRRLRKRFHIRHAPHHVSFSDPPDVELLCTPPSPGEPAPPHTAVRHPGYPRAGHHVYPADIGFLPSVTAGSSHLPPSSSDSAAGRTAVVHTGDHRHRRGTATTPVDPALRTDGHTACLEHGNQLHRRRRGTVAGRLRLHFQ
ncbi:hypothetical protein EC11E007_29040 [Escherichia coli]|nr:hypothetical protein EC11E007_29040 [Escherichia coli]